MSKEVGAGKLDVHPEDYFTEDILVSMGNRLYLIMLKLTGLYGLIFAFLNFLIGSQVEIIISLILIPVCGFTWWLFQRGNKVFSKVISLVMILMVISLDTIINPPESLAPVFYIPTMICMLIIFQGKEQKIGLFMAFIGFILMLIFLSYDFHFGQEDAKSVEKIRIDRIINTAGASLMCILEVLFVVRVGASIQHLLVDRSERLDHSNRRLTSLVQSRESMMSILSHDLRSPLTLIVSTLDLMRPGRFPPDQLEGLVEKVSNRTRSTLLMLDSLLLWSRSHLEGAGFEKEKISLKAIRKNLLDYCELLSAEKVVEYEILIPEEAEILANHAMLETILRNLISNAFKFTPAGGRIFVKAERQEQNFAFFVEDNGQGMSPESLQRLKNGIAFSTDGTDREKGHGLGIQIVRDFLQKLDSTIEVHSEPGKGTQFVFTLPQE